VASLLAKYRASRHRTAGLSSRAQIPNLATGCFRGSAVLATEAAGIWFLLPARALADSAYSPGFFISDKGYGWGVMVVLAAVVLAIDRVVLRMLRRIATDNASVSQDDSDKPAGEDHHGR
jgi:hypothetical protein